MNTTLSYKSRGRYFLLLILLSMLGMCATPSHASTKDLQAVDTTDKELIECARIVEILYNSEDYYYELSISNQKRIQALRAAITTMLEAKGLVLGAEKDIEGVVSAYTALDDSQKAEIAKLTKEVGKLERRKNFWKSVAILEGVAVGVVALFILIK